MIRLITPALIGLSLAMASPALAKSKRGFDSSVTAPVSTPVKVEVIISDDLQHRANNLPEDKRDWSSRTLDRRNGFANNGFYGQKDLDRLAQRVQSRMERQLSKRGVELDANAPIVLRVTLEDVKNNRPTFEQMSVRPGLSFESYGIGGAELSAQLIQSGGRSLGDMSYRWYENSIRDAAYATTWTDAHRAIDRFSRKAAKSLGQ